MGDEEENEKKAEKKKKSPSKYCYSFGDCYPGQTVGRKHDPLTTQYYNVPAHMGFLWTAPDIPGFKAKRGWQPGAISKTVAKMMTFKCARGASEKDRNKKKKKRRTPGQGEGKGDGDSETDEPLIPKPALRVQRKGDCFTIEVNPLKDLTDIRPNEDPYVDCDPLIFKIYKKRSPEERAKVEARRMVKLKKQRDAEIRKALTEAVEDICKCAYMDVFCNDYAAIDKVIDNCPAFVEPGCICEEESLSSLSSNATWDIDYTPPFGCFDTAPRRRKHYVHVETQYIHADAGIEEPPKPKTCRKACCHQKPACCQQNPACCHQKPACQKPKRTQKHKSCRPCFGY